MAKYSTGGVGGEDADSCELCGSSSANLQTANVAGATLQVCSECAHHGEDDSPTGGSESSEEQKRRKKAAQNVARLSDANTGDSKHWEEDGTDYQRDPLPYLVRGYGERVEAARQEAGLQTDELAGELGVDEADVIAIEQGRANRAGIGGSLIEDIEERLNVQLSEDA